MRLYSFTADAGRAIADFGSVGMTITPVLRAAGEAQVGALWLAPGGAVGRHAASGAQLLLVTQGAGWVVSGDGARHTISAGQAAWWDDDELHETRAGDAGLAAIVIEGDALDLTRLHRYPNSHSAPLSRRSRGWIRGGAFTQSRARQ